MSSHFPFIAGGDNVFTKRHSRTVKASLVLWRFLVKAPNIRFRGARLFDNARRRDAFRHGVVSITCVTSA